MVIIPFIFRVLLIISKILQQLCTKQTYSVLNNLKILIAAVFPFQFLHLQTNINLNTHTQTHYFVSPALFYDFTSENFMSSLNQIYLLYLSKRNILYHSLINI